MSDIVERIEQGIGDGWKALAKEAVVEIQQLRMQLADHGETITRLETEIERLRALSQNNAHSWDDIVRERNELRTEIERLKIESNERVTKLLAQIVALKADNERLRAELADVRADAALLRMWAGGA